MPIPTTRIPHLIPDAAVSMISPSLPATPVGTLYDIAINSLPFLYASDNSNPSIRQTAPFEKQRIDSEDTAGEQTLTNWWIKSQDSFHGGAGQLQLEPAVPTPVSPTRFSGSKNVDVFTPGQVTRLPDTKVISTDTSVAMVSCVVSGADAIAYVTTGGSAKLLTVLDGTVATSTFSGSGVSNIVSLATDGTSIYAASHTNVYKLDPTNVSSVTTLVTFPASSTDAVLGWCKARLMLGQAGSVYSGIDQASAHTLVAAGTDTFFLYKHPTTGFVWRCFAESPTAILAAGDAGGTSVINQFDTQAVATVPTLVPDGQIGALPIGERVLSMLNVEGTFLGIGTTKGIRIGEFDSYFGRLTYGPLQLLATDPTIPCNIVLSRDRFVFAVGSAYDEGGLIAVDLATKTDQAGRWAWSSHLISPAFTATAATSGCALQNSSRLAFYISGTGIVLEQVGAGGGREAWLQTSRIRYGTTEPKLFKLGRVRGDLTTGEIAVTSITSPGDTTVIGTYGFTTIDPTEFKLPAGGFEWLQLKLTLLGATTSLTSYQVKALPGTARQREIQAVLSLFDSEITRNGVLVEQRGSARGRLSALEALDAAGDEVLLQEFTPTGVVSTVVVIEQMKFTQSARPTRTSDLGGTVAVLMRTVGG